MRRLKDADEVARLEEAIAVTGDAVTAAMAAARPGMVEHELEGEMLRVYRSRGAGLSFESIVASGPNACFGHYRDNSRRIEAGELVLLDTGGSVGGYRADVTRTFPVDGRFTARQREVYEAVLDAERQAIASVRPGVTLGDVHARAFDVIEAAGFGPAFYHGTAHYLGLHTHDVGDPFAPLEPGAVITVEPGIYLPDEAIGIRIEDDVLVTEGGRRVLTEAIPKELEEVEAMAGGRPARGRR
jgi:Xaa-Pro aminopeptidase